jgi:hypothetical protein
MNLGLNLGFSPSRRGSSSGGGRAGGVTFWTFTQPTTGKSLTSISVNFTKGIVVDWGDGTAPNYYSIPNVIFSKTFQSNSSGITLYRDGNLSNISIISTAAPTLGGDIDISGFTSLIAFSVSSAGVNSLTGYANSNSIYSLGFPGNNFGSTGTLPSTLNMSELNFFDCSSSNIGGTLPVLNTPNITEFLCQANNFTGSIPSLSGLDGLREFDCSTNRLTGSIPILSGLITLEEFRCENQKGATKLTGSIPILSGLIQLQVFSCFTNQLTGSIPSLSGLDSLREFYCFSNQLTGSIPSLSGLTNLQDFRCQTNQLTGSIPSLSGLTNLQTFNCSNQTGATKLTGFDGGSVSITLGNFQAQNNELTSTAVNSILSAFVAAGRTSANGACNLNLGGTGNATPTGQGLTDKATLISRGWTVTTN